MDCEPFDTLKSRRRLWQVSPPTASKDLVSGGKYVVGNLSSTQVNNLMNMLPSKEPQMPWSLAD